jgi:hypothetical protein
MVAENNLKIRPSSVLYEAKGGKNMSPTFHISEQSKIFSQPDISADMESYRSHPNVRTSSSLPRF